MNDYSAYLDYQERAAAREAELNAMPCDCCGIYNHVYVKIDMFRYCLNCVESEIVGFARNWEITEAEVIEMAVLHDNGNEFKYNNLTK